MQCLNCGQTVLEPERFKERIGEYFGDVVYEESMRCPYCKGEVLCDGD